MRDRTFAAGVVASLAATALILVLGTSGRSATDPGLALTPVPERPGAAVARAADAPTPRDPRVRSELRRLAAQGGKILDERIADRLARLRGVPVVVNMWASWCPSCRSEFPAFATVSDRYRGKVAFLGLDAGDDRGEAERFLREFPLPYPSVFDPRSAQSRAIGAGRSWPTTVFFDARGKRTFVRQGGYTGTRLLDADVRTYALAR
ncbi:TlpA family protein disulfide reductase [Paraconexibacter sp.]|uniref:TlpA family protein disulfide reductase n=1 Tax=Paraconexibacter sp. TaxID=2949640 RepID=UPI003567D1C0